MVQQSQRARQRGAHETTMKNPAVSVLIPNWNGRQVLPDCLYSLTRQTFRDFEIILVDNASEDESLQFVREKHPEVKIVQLGMNSGFGKAINAGAMEARGEYIALLNNDTRADSLWLEELCRKLDNEKDVHFCSCKILNFYRKDYICELGQFYCKDGTIVQIGAGLRDTGTLDGIVKKIFGPCGAAAIYRKSIFEEIGGFDESFFLYFEDVDFNFRAQLRGYTCHYVPTGVVFHRSGFSTSRMPDVYRHMIRNRISVMIKNMPEQLFIQNGEAIYRCLKEEYRIMEEKGKARMFHEALSDLAQRSNSLLEKRKIILAGRKISDHELEKLMVERHHMEQITARSSVLSMFPD